jgi:formylglycine-generating enzyme
VLWAGVAVVVLASAGLLYRIMQPRVVTPNGRCPHDMRLIPAGAFDFSEAEQRQVASFCLHATEVTLNAYAACVNSGACTEPNGDQAECNWNRGDRHSHPINCVTWEQAKAYCAWAGFRLPTEVEWEYAARGGSEERDYPWGDEFATNKLACWARNRTNLGTCPADAHPAFAFGLHGMAGNVEEWTADNNLDAQERLSFRADKPAPNDHVARGGTWGIADPMLLQGKLRFIWQQSHTASTVGFRCATNPR